MKRTGVIVGTTIDLTREQAESIVALLERRYPTVTITVLQHGHSIAFEYDDGEWAPPDWSTHVPTIEDIDTEPLIVFEPEHLERRTRRRRQ